VAGTVYANVSDITALGVVLTPQQQSSAEVLLSQASSRLRISAKKFGKDIDALIADDEDYGDAVKSVVVQAVIRALNSLSDTDPAVSQVSQSGLGFSASMTYFNAGQSLYFLKSELKDLGLMRQSYGALEVYENGSDASGN
jgi:hypothetical protein